MSRAVVKERPILFRAEMVRAILAGTKTQTRRPVKFPKNGPDWSGPDVPDLSVLRDDEDKSGWHFYEIEYPGEGSLFMRCPYGAPGDRLWLKETWGVGTRPDPIQGWIDGIEYKADEDDDPHGILPLYTQGIPEDFDFEHHRGGWRPSIFMPRWASRIDLEITSVRVERLDDISGDEVFAEGIDNGRANPTMGDRWHNLQREAFSDLWDKIYGPGAWAKNPWVWVIEFKRVRP